MLGQHLHLHNPESMHSAAGVGPGARRRAAAWAFATTGALDEQAPMDRHDASRHAPQGLRW